MFSKILKWLLTVQMFICFNFAICLDRHFQTLINLDQRCVDELPTINLPDSIITVSPANKTIKISGELREFNKNLLSHAKSLKKTGKIKPDLEPALLYYTLEIDMSDKVYQDIVNLTSLYMIPFLIYEGIIYQTKYNDALKNRLQLIEELCDTHASSLPTDIEFLRSFHSSIYRNLMLPLINSTVETVEGASRNPERGGVYTLPKSITEHSRNIRIKLERLVKADSMPSYLKSWKEKIENAATLTDLRRFLLATCFCDISFIERSIIYPKNILIIHQNFFEDLYIAEHANSKHLTQDSDSKGEFASFFDFIGVDSPPDKTTRTGSSDLPSEDEARKAELERRARIVAESMYNWMLDPSITQIYIEPSENEFNIFLKIIDLRKTPDIKHLVYSSKSGKTTDFSDIILFPIKPLLGKYTLSKSAFPYKDKPIPPETTALDPFKKGNLLKILDNPSRKETLFDELNAMKKTSGMSSSQIELLKQLNIDDISWIIEGTVNSNNVLKRFIKIPIPTDLLNKMPADLAEQMMYDAFKAYLWESGGVEEIWIINKENVNRIPLF